MRASWLPDACMSNSRFNLNTFAIASAMISNGMNWWQAFMWVLLLASLLALRLAPCALLPLSLTSSCVIVGYTLVGPLLVLNARPGAVHGITFSGRQPNDVRRLWVPLACRE